VQEGRKDLTANRQWMMAIPDFDANGFLPAGYHDCSLHEIADTFCFTTKRKSLFQGLHDYCQQWVVAAISLPIFVDGGFASVRPDEPKDVDLILDISGLDLRDPHVCTTVNRLLDHAPVLATFGVDAYAYHPVIMINDFRLWFSYVKPAKRLTLGLDDTFRKGMLRVQV
jgi:hypothetical protein